MKIAFDAKRLFNNHTGLGNYSRTLVQNLFHFYPQNEYVLASPNSYKSQFLREFSNSKIIDPKPKFSSYWRSFPIYKDVNNVNPDIYHGLSNEIPFTSRKIKAKKIVTIHDLFFEKFPQDFRIIDRKIYKAKTSFACKNADHIIAISEATKKDIIDILGIDPNKISVIYQSCHSIYQKPEVVINKTNNTSLIPSEFFLYVGTINKRKNLRGIIKAMNLIPRESLLPIVIVGTGNEKFVKIIKSEIQKYKLENYVTFLGKKSNSELRILYQKAKFLCLPSFYEGFGIPIIESLFSNTPVITSNTSSLPEATGDCGLEVDPNNTFEMSAALQKMTESADLLDHLQSNIPLHLTKFTSHSTANSLQNLYLSMY